ncbi:hypothetical protein [Tichowtungia aerotolerans]|uniref:Uncharacterized protein n=1 Tax=Tichowtungia aerotolerans TaxID=2697043 RepID=A0A6P1MC56_9BACT|nr:hypothetical protein [Tichowtungia aerotolerans]QHI70144.1 hypothetical protein GT409_12045 [Tichowtungia aerotolerans]
MSNSWILDGQKAEPEAGGAGNELLVELKLNSSGGSTFLFGTHHTKIGCGQFTPIEVFDPENCWASDAFTAPSDGVYEFVVEGVHLEPICSTMVIAVYPFGFGVLINDTFIYYSKFPKDDGTSIPGQNSHPDSRAKQFRIQLELTAGDTCKLVSLADWIPFHSLHPSYTDAHAGPASSKIRIYKCALS